ncbi:MAG: PASTA domain-containing protein [Gemmatimonadaceae bacterium]
MDVGRGALVAHLFTTLFQQPATQAVRWAPPAPCGGDSTETHAYRGNPIAVPNLDDMPLLRARTTLARLGLKLEVRSVRMDGPTGLVIAQSPTGGSLAIWGDVVIICARRSPVFPDVGGLTFDAAQKILRDAGYVAIKTNSFVDRPSHVGVVFRQQPNAGAAASRGSVDTLIVGMTPPIAAVPPSQSSQGQLPRVSPSSRAPDSAASRQVPSAPSDIDEPMDWSWLWKVAVGVGVVLAVAAAVRKVKDKRRLAGLRVTPYQHAGHSRVVNAKRHD